MVRRNPADFPGSTPTLVSYVLYLYRGRCVQRGQT
jgi:hypothetical protein